MDKWRKVICMRKKIILVPMTLKLKVPPPSTSQQGRQPSVSRIMRYTRITGIIRITRITSVVLYQRDLERFTRFPTPSINNFSNFFFVVSTLFILFLVSVEFCTIRFCTLASHGRFYPTCSFLTLPRIPIRISTSG